VPWDAIYPFFLLRQLLLDATNSRRNARRQRKVDALYIVGSILVYGGILLAWN